MKNKLDFLLLFGAFCSIILTQFVQQDISIVYNHFNSDYSFISDYNTYKKSILSYLFFLFDIFNLESSGITIFISIFFTSIAMITVSVFALHVKKMNILNLCYFLCMLYFLEKLHLINSGFNYPLNIIVPGFNTGGSLGLLFSISTIVTLHASLRAGSIFTTLNLFIHPSLGLLTLSYACLFVLGKKRYYYLLLLLTVCAVFLYFNFDSDVSNKNLVNFIHLNDFHRRPIRIQDLKFLIFPCLLTILHTNKKDLITEWIYVFICILTSFIYYNLKLNILELPFLSLMPSRGANLAIGLIFIKSCADLIINSKINRFISLLIIAIVLNQIFYSSMQLTSLFIGCTTGLIVLFVSKFFNITLISKHNPNSIYKMRDLFILPILFSFIIYINLLSAFVNINQLVYGKPKPYDEFFSSVEKEHFYIDLVGDYSLSNRNKKLTPLIDLSVMDAYSYNTKIFEEGNQIFKMIFKKNLWDINMNNSAQLKYKMVSNILENYTSENWKKLKENNIDYILCPSSSKIKLNRSWENEEYIIFNLNSY